LRTSKWVTFERSDKRLNFIDMNKWKSYLTVLGVVWSLSAMAQSVGYIENKGQWNDEVVAKYTLPNGDAWFLADRVRIPIFEQDAFHEAMHIAHDEPDARIDLEGHTYEMRFGSTEGSVNDLYGRHKDYVNFYLGKDRSKWASRVGVYDKLSFYEVQPGVDLHWQVQEGNMKYTFYVSDRVDPSGVFVEYLAVRSLRVEGGNLKIQLPNTTVEEQAPYAFQLIGGERVEVECAFRVEGNRVYFDLGDYDPSYMLYIDPVVVASTNIGSQVNTWGHSATFDQFGNIYGGGRPFGTGYPVDTGSFQIDFAGGGNDIGLSKLDTNGSTLLWSTYIGGTGADYVHSIVVNGFNDVVVYGKTNSLDYPVSVSALDTSFNGGWDVCLTILSDSGDSLIGSTYLGGEGDDGNNALNVGSYSTFKGEVVCDIYSNVFVATTSSSDSIQVSNNAFMTTKSGGQDGYVAKLNYNLSQLLFGTYVGDSLNDGAFNVKPAKDGTVYVVGATASPGFPTTTGAEDEDYNGGNSDGFILRLSGDGTDLLQSTFIRSDTASNDADRGLFLQIDRNGYIYVLGGSNGSIVADSGKYTGPSTNQGSFIRKYTKTLDSIYWTTTFASVAHSAFLVDNCKNIYAAGNNASANNDYELTANAVQPTQAGFYIIVLNAEADSIIHGTYYGTTASHVDGGTSRFDKRGAVYQATCTSGFNFPQTANAWSGNQNGGTYDLTVFKIDFEVQAAVANAQVAPSSVGCVPHTVDFTNFGSQGLSHAWIFGDGDTALTQTPSHTYNSPGVYEVTYVVFDTVGCVFSDTATLIITVLDTSAVEILSDSAICTESVNLSIDNPFANYLWSTGEVSASIDVDQTASYWVEVTHQCGTFTDTIDVEIIPPYDFTLINDTGICEPGFLLEGPNDGVSFLWSTGDTTQSIEVNATGTYILKADNGFCSDSDTVNIQVSYINFSTTDTVVCTESLELSVENNDGTILWSTGDTTESILVTQEGTYWVFLENGFCSTTDTINVDLSPTLVDLGPDTIICEPVTFSAFNPELTSYAWSTGDSASAILVDTSMTLWVIGNNGLCSDTDSVNVELQTLSFSITEELVCDLDSHYLVAPGPTGSEFLWSTGDTTRNTTVYGSGTYYVTVSTGYCSLADSLKITFGNAPVFSIGEDRMICNGEEVRVSVDSVYSTVRWNTGDTGRTVLVKDSGLIIASMSVGGCEGRDSIAVTWRTLDPDSFFLVPNVMTPNGDGLNDVLGLTIANPNLVTDYELFIYNRWGVLVFESEFINHDWDGKLPSGDDAEEATYFYIFRANTVCTDLPIIEVKDNVTLIRGK